MSGEKRRMRSPERSHSASATRDNVAATWNVTVAFFWLTERAWLLDRISHPIKKVVRSYALLSLGYLGTQGIQQVYIAIVFFCSIDGIFPGFLFVRLA